MLKRANRETTISLDGVIKDLVGIESSGLGDWTGPLGKLYKLPAIFRPIKDAVLAVVQEAEIVIANEWRSPIPHIVDHFQRLFPGE